MDKEFLLLQAKEAAAKILSYLEMRAIGVATNEALNLLELLETISKCAA